MKELSQHTEKSEDRIYDSIFLHITNIGCFINKHYHSSQERQIENGDFSQKRVFILVANSNSPLDGYVSRNIPELG